MFNPGTFPPPQVYQGLAFLRPAHIFMQVQGGTWTWLRSSQRHMDLAFKHTGHRGPWVPKWTIQPSLVCRILFTNSINLVVHAALAGTPASRDALIEVRNNWSAGWAFHGISGVGDAFETREREVEVSFFPEGQGPYNLQRWFLYRSENPMLEVQQQTALQA